MCDDCEALKADVELRMKPWQDRDVWATMCRAEPAMCDELLAAWNSRDEAFAESVRLREQLEAVRAACEGPRFWFNDGEKSIELIPTADVLAILEAK